MLELTDKEFATLRDFVLSNYGIDLSKKRILIQGRLSTMLQQKGFNNYMDYISFVQADKSGNEINTLLNKLTTNLTYFMREKEHFNFVRDVLLPEFDASKKREIRVWSAGCSSGEEPYTLAMTLMDYYAQKPTKPKISILASDISQNVLGKAQQAVYELEGLKDLPQGWISKYFDKINDNEYRVKQEVRSKVTFRTVNLMDTVRFSAPFEILFCRNVMIYFDKDKKRELVNRFYEWTAPGYYFFISHSENIERNATKFRMVKASVFRKD